MNARLGLSEPNGTVDQIITVNEFLRIFALARHGLHALDDIAGPEGVLVQLGANIAHLLKIAGIDQSPAGLCEQ